MNNVIREKRKFVFSGLRITAQNVKSLAHIIEQEVSNLTSENKIFFVNYSVDAADNSSYESESSVIFNEERIIAFKVIEKITMRFSANDYSKNIEIDITPLLTDEKGENFVLVSGDDSNWVNGIMERLNEILDAIEPQPKILTTIQWINGLSWVGLYIVNYRLIAGVVRHILSEDLAAYYSVISFFCFCFIGNYMHKYFTKLFPLIELQTGPKHLQLPSEKRKKVGIILSLIIIPLLLAIIYDVVKSVFSK